MHSAKSHPHFRTSILALRDNSSSKRRIPMINFSHWRSYGSKTACNILRGRVFFSPRFLHIFILFLRRDYFFSSPTSTHFVSRPQAQSLSLWPSFVLSSSLFSFISASFLRQRFLQAAVTFLGHFYLRSWSFFLLSFFFFLISPRLSGSRFLI